jgi:hypothetical protein
MAGPHYDLMIWVNPPAALGFLSWLLPQRATTSKI